MKFVGVNIGSLSVKIVALEDQATEACVLPHHGRPLEVLQTVLAGKDYAGAAACGVCGHLGEQSEAAAVQRALTETGEEFDAIASLGGESFLVFLVTEGRISNVLSHNKCAAGSGEFFIQQIGRMGIERDEAIRRSFSGKVIPLASRCSVHCKSDITHKLNRHEATPEDILYTLHDSMAHKVVALLEKGQCRLRRVLLIGGLARNAAMVAALRSRLSGAEVVVRPESPWFEAWGSALLTRDRPEHTSPKIRRQAPMGTHPPLRLFADLVRVVPRPARQGPSVGPLILGLDAGSTTTKAVLLDPSTRGVVASHYARTRGDPVSATRECLLALDAGVGGCRIASVATTGSARELVGAFLGTDQVTNEISAHAAGAAHFDPEVDTIFEIGGQDSKYIRLHNGVPVDYAMNNACSAGTGSFLEESAHGDLGIGVSGIAELALSAPAPVQFKSTCAAFINTDIRLALQNGHSREDIVAGLVYAIAGNYLQRVKGPRSVGKKVFFQGGVALNQAIGHAFARTVGRTVVIPPDPELLGALGVAILALDRSGRADAPETDLRSLAAAEMKSLGGFTCRACRMYCRVDRFEVNGRRFPFGGRCSLYENVWKRRARFAKVPDLVEKRSEILFDEVEGGLRASPGPVVSAAAPVRRVGLADRTLESARSLLEEPFRRPGHNGVPLAPGTRIGLPRALTTHSLFPLFATFLSEAGFEVILSGVDPEGELKTNSGFCFPVQIAHGAVLDLARHGVRVVFLPHVVRMPQAASCRDSYLCPISQAGSYVLAKAFPDLCFLSPVLDFSSGYGGTTALVRMAVEKLGLPRQEAERAWSVAVKAQTETEEALGRLGREALERALSSGKPTVVLAGRSYNAFTADASQSVGRKLASMGIEAIPADCLAPGGEGPMAWHFANQIMNAVELVRRHPNLFLLCVSNFSCTVDAFTHSQLAEKMGAKPHLVLEIDAHTADAGVQTRLEAFLETVHNFREAEERAASPFVPCRLVGAGRILRTNGESIALGDPRVKISLPNFSSYHVEALALALRWLGLHPGETSTLDPAQLERGLQRTSGRECLPMPICVGQLLQIAADRQPGEIAGYYMLSGGAPCVSDAYLGAFRRFLVEQRLPDVFLLDPGPENDYLGFGAGRFAQHILPAISVADILVEIENVLHVVGPAGSPERLREEWFALRSKASGSIGRFDELLPGFIGRLAALPRDRDPSKCPRVVVTGDFFTRFSPFFMSGVRNLYAAHGIILKPVDLNELLLYGSYCGLAGTAHGWGMKPGRLALARACMKGRQPDGRRYLERWLTYQAERRVETRYRTLFHRSGLLVAEPNDASSIYETASAQVSPSIFGELIPTVGKALEARKEGYDGVILIGPFNCLPFRASEAILKPLSIQQGMPMLSYESDGYPVSPAVLRQVDVHVQQVLAHAAARPASGKTRFNGWADRILAADREQRLPRSERTTPRERSDQ